MSFFIVSVNLPGAGLKHTPNSIPEMKPVVPGRISNSINMSETSLFTSSGILNSTRFSYIGICNEILNGHFHKGGLFLSNLVFYVLCHVLDFLPVTLTLL